MTVFANALRTIGIWCRSCPASAGGRQVDMTGRRRWVSRRFLMPSSRIRYRMVLGPLLVTALVSWWAINGRGQDGTASPAAGTVSNLDDFTIVKTVTVEF